MNQSDAMLREASWAVRTVPEPAIIDYLLVWHMPAPRGRKQVDSARKLIAAALNRWKAMGLPYANVDGQPQFDPGEVFNFAMTAGALGVDDYLIRSHAVAHAEMVQSFHGPAGDMAHVPDAGNLPPRHFRITLRRDYNLSDFAVGSRVRLRLPVPLADHSLDLRSISFTTPDGAQHRHDRNRLEVQLNLETPGIVELGLEASFIARPDVGQDQTLSEEDLRLYTAQRENLIIVSPAIRQLAEDIGGGETDTAALTLRFYDYIGDNFQIGIVPYHELDRERPTDWAIDHGCFDCQMGSTLLCALCRASGIPARLVSGYQLYETNLSYHYWAQIWIDGRWLSFDYLTWAAARLFPEQGWRRALAGKLDYRMKVQIMPSAFTGPSSLSLSAIWHKLAHRADHGLSNEFTDASTNKLLYRDTLEIISLSPCREENT